MAGGSRWSCIRSARNSDSVSDVEQESSTTRDRSMNKTASPGTCLSRPSTSGIGVQQSSDSKTASVGHASKRRMAGYFFDQAEGFSVSSGGSGWRRLRGSVLVRRTACKTPPFTGMANGCSSTASSLTKAWQEPKVYMSEHMMWSIHVCNPAATACTHVPASLAGIVRPAMFHVMTAPLSIVIADRQASFFAGLGNG